MTTPVWWLNAVLAFWAGPRTLSTPAEGSRRFDTAAGGVPLMVESRDRVLRLRGADLGEGAEFLGVDADSLLSDALGGGAARKGGLVFDAAEEARAGVARAGAGRTTIADPELFEALGARRRLKRPAAVRADLERGELGSAGDHDLGARGGFVGDGPTDLARVFLVERDGLRDQVSPGGEDDAHWLGQRAG